MHDPTVVAAVADWPAPPLRPTHPRFLRLARLVLLSSMVAGAVLTFCLSELAANKAEARMPAQAPSAAAQAARFDQLHAAMDELVAQERLLLQEIKRVRYQLGQHSRQRVPADGVLIDQRELQKKWERARRSGSPCVMTIESQGKVYTSLCAPLAEPSDVRTWRGNGISVATCPTAR